MMICKYRKVARGLTLIELMVAILASMVLIIAVSAMLYHGHVGYNRLFRRVNSEVVRNAYEARRTFDVLVRRSSIRRCDLLNGNNEAYIFYFYNPQNMAIEDPDRYARFYLSGTQLMLEQGDVGAGTFEVPPPALPARLNAVTGVLARSVRAPNDGIFSMQGAAVRMVLILDDESDPPAGVSKLETLKITVTTEAIRYNW